MLWVYVCVINVIGITSELSTCSAWPCDGVHAETSRKVSLLQYDANVAQLIHGLPELNDTAAFMGEDIEASTAFQKQPPNSTEFQNQPPNSTEFQNQPANIWGIVSNVAWSPNSIGVGKISLFALLIFTSLNIWLVWRCYAGDKSVSRNEQKLISHTHTGKAYLYSNEGLLTWQIFLTKTPSVVMSWRTWIVVPCVLGTANLVVLMIFFIPNAILVGDVQRLGEFARYLKVFIAFMLGMFMSKSFARWQLSVSTFRQLLTSVKQLLYALRTMQLRKELVDELERKCLLACYIVDAELRSDEGCRAANTSEEHWENTWDFLKEAGISTKKEDEALRAARGANLDEMGRYSMMIWSWIGESITEVRSEPGVLVPMYMKLISISQSCIGQVDKLKTSVQVQVPFTYSYLLSMLVHLNNAILAVCAGLAIGASLTQINADKDAGTSTPSGITPAEMGLQITPSGKQKHALYKAFEILGMQTLILLVQPLMYQACLVIAHALNHPFGDHISHLPTETYILNLREELQVLADSFAKYHAGASDEKKDGDADDDDDGGDDT